MEAAPATPSGEDCWLAHPTLDPRRKSVTRLDAPLSAERLNGIDVHNMKGEDIGAVDDVLMTMKDGATHVLVGHGGFLGIGDKEVAIPLYKAKISLESNTLYIPISEEQMDQAPDFDYVSYHGNREAWRKDNDSAYGN